MCGELVFVKMLICLSHKMFYYLLKLQMVNQPIENILQKHNTGVVLCFNKNILFKMYYISIY